MDDEDAIPMPRQNGKSVGNGAGFGLGINHSANGVSFTNSSVMLGPGEIRRRVQREGMLAAEGFKFLPERQVWRHPESGSAIGMEKLIHIPDDQFNRFLNYSRGDIVWPVDPVAVQQRLDHLVQMARAQR